MRSGSRPPAAAAAPGGGSSAPACAAPLHPACCIAARPPPAPPRVPRLTCSRLCCLGAACAPLPSFLQNHEVYARGEPAFLKYWLTSPATLRSSGALEAEEGFSQVRGAAAAPVCLCLWPVLRFVLSVCSWHASNAAPTSSQGPPSSQTTPSSPNHHRRTMWPRRFRPGCAARASRPPPSSATPRIASRSWWLTRQELLVCCSCLLCKCAVQRMC